MIDINNIEEGPIRWEELTDYIGKPVYDANRNNWHILCGYSEKYAEYADEKRVILSSFGDKPKEKLFIDVALYNHEVKNEKEENKDN